MPYSTVFKVFIDFYSCAEYWGLGQGKVSVCTLKVWRKNMRFFFEKVINASVD